jgi:glycosyltransferase involved in cell wall biosynthesis
MDSSRSGDIAAPVGAPTVAILLQGLLVGGMERCALQVATCARRAGYDARILLFDTPYQRSADEYVVDDVPVSCVLRRGGLDLRFLMRLRRVFNHWNVQLVHARNQVAGIYSAAALAKPGMAALPLIVTFDTFPGPGSMKARLASRWATRKSAFVTAVSHDLCERVTAHGWAAHCMPLRNGVDIKEFAPSRAPGNLRSRLGIPADAILVAQLARVDRNKRQIDLLTAFQAVRAVYPECALVFAGDGPEWGRLRDHCSQVPRVHLLRRVSDVPGFLREVDISVLCSDDEGAPRALLEAMACGCAVIGTKVGGIPEIVGDSGVLVPGRRPDLLAAAIERLCSERELREHLGRRARRRICEHFTMEREWQEYSDLYRSVLHAVPAGVPELVPGSTDAMLP